MSYFSGDDITEVIIIKRGKKNEKSFRRPSTNETVYWQSAECATPVEVKFYKLRKIRPEAEFEGVLHTISR